MRTLLEIKQSDFDSWCRQNRAWEDFRCVMRVNNEAVYGIASVMCEVPPCENSGKSPLISIIPEKALMLSSVVITANVTFYGETGFWGDVTIAVRFSKGLTVIKDKQNRDLFGITRTFYNGGVRNEVMKWVVAGTKLTVYTGNVQVLSTELVEPPTDVRIFVFVKSNEGLLGIGGIRYLKIEYDDPLGEVMDIFMNMLPLFMLFFMLMMFFNMFSGFFSR